MRCAPSHAATLSRFATARPPAAAISRDDLVGDRALVAFAGEADAEIVDDDRRAGAREIERDAATYAATRARDDCDLAIHHAHRAPSVALRQLQHLFGDEAQDQLFGDRREARQRRLAVETLDVIFLGVAETAMRHHRLPGGVVTGAGAEELRAVGLGAAGAAGIVELGGLIAISQADSRYIHFSASGC